MSMKMDSKDIERKLLLRMTGELSKAEVRQLERELESHPRARALEAEIQAIFCSARSGESEAVIADSVRQAIRREASRALDEEEKSERTEATFAFPNMWRPAMVYAAAALLLLAILIPTWRYLATDQMASSAQIPSLEWDEDLDQQLARLDAELTVALLEYAETADADRSIEALAREYIELEETEI